MGARSKARKRALDVLFEADQRGSDPRSTVLERSGQAQEPFAEYAFDLVEGVTTHRMEIDQILAEYAEGWTLNRMPAVDRVALRIATYELLWAPDVPDGVAISEAVGLVRDLSTDASPGFVNGLLAKIASIEPARSAGAAPAGGSSDDSEQPQPTQQPAQPGENAQQGRDDVVSSRPPMT